MNRIILTWEEYDKMLDELVIKIKKLRKNFNGVYGIPRGGLILAVCLSHRLKIPMLLHPIGNCIIVDDISDFGTTLLKYRDDFFIVALYSTPWTKVIPILYIKEKKKKGDWIIFPWEVQK